MNARNTHKAEEAFAKEKHVREIIAEARDAIATKMARLLVAGLDDRFCEIGGDGTV